MSKFAKWIKESKIIQNDMSEVASHKTLWLVRDGWNAALIAAREECTKSEERQGGGHGVRHCFEILEAIDNLRDFSLIEDFDIKNGGVKCQKMIYFR